MLRVQFICRLKRDRHGQLLWHNCVMCSQGILTGMGERPFQDHFPHHAFRVDALDPRSATFSGWHIRKCAAKTTFLNGILPEEI